MVVEVPRGERANDEARRLERLVDRRRLVDQAGDRLEVVGVEGVGIDQAVPADHIERVVGHCVAGHPLAVLDQHGHVLIFVDDIDLARTVEVALIVRRPCGSVRPG